jgi:hypothetical protein
MKENLDADQIIKNLKELQSRIDANLAYLENEKKNENKGY